MKKTVFTWWLLRFCLVFAGIHSMAMGQDTLRFMHYNLLHYGVSDAGCTPVSTSTKNGYLLTILGAAQPDIFTVNEMGTSNLYAENITLNVLRTFHPDWQHGTYTNNAGSNLVNMLFYRGDKLAMYSEHVIQHSLRDINLYTLYYRDPDLGASADTTFVNIVVVHLKAGSTAQDESERNSQATTIMSYLNGIGKPGNYFISGDFNLKSSTEASYQTFLTEPNTQVRMYDPISAPGSWNANANFETIHTQSTRQSAQPDCGSSGGMDDRFDFIVCNNYVLGDSARVKYLSGTYKAFGNDGQHFNGNINGSPTNSAVSASVANALYSMSDHLPVMMDLAFDVTLATSNREASSNKITVFPNPFSGEINLNLPEMAEGSLLITDMQGRAIYSGIFEAAKPLTLQTADWARGVYFLKATTGNGATLSTRLVKVD